MGQTRLFGDDVGVEFSADLFCKFAKCSMCGDYLFRVDNRMGLHIGDVVPYTFFHGDLVCIECWKNREVT